MIPETIVTSVTHSLVSQVTHVNLESSTYLAMTSANYFNFSKKEVIFFSFFKYKKSICFSFRLAHFESAPKHGFSGGGVAQRRDAPVRAPRAGNRASPLANSCPLFSRVPGVLSPTPTVKTDIPRPTQCTLRERPPLQVSRAKLSPLR